MASRRDCRPRRFAAGEASESLQIFIASAVARSLWGWMALAAGIACHLGRRYRTAEGAYRRAFAARPRSVVALQLLGQSLEGQGRWEEAATLYGQMLDRDRNSGIAYYLRAQCLLNGGRAVEAAEDARRAIRCHPPYFAAYVVLGRALRCQGRPNDAVAAFEQAAALNPRSRAAAELLEQGRD